MGRFGENDSTFFRSYLKNVQSRTVFSSKGEASRMPGGAVVRDRKKIPKSISSSDYSRSINRFLRWEKKTYAGFDDNSSVAYVCVEGK